MLRAREWMIAAACLIAMGSAAALAIGGGDLTSSDMPVQTTASPPVGPPDGVSGAMLKAAAADPQNWLMYGGDYKNYRHSPITALNPAAVRKLKVAWSFPTGTTGQFEASPVIYGGVMYVTTSCNRLFALNAGTGKLLWRYDYPLPDGLTACCGPVNRGAAISGDLVFMATLDAHLVALDRRTGAVKWNVEIASYKDGFAATSAPLVIGGKVINGIAGGDNGVRGFFRCV